MQTGRTDQNTPSGNRRPHIDRMAAYLGGIPLVLPVLHGASGPWDEVVIFGGMGAILLGLAFVSYRSGQKRKRRRSSRRTRR